jgi:hypothetical protein
MLSHGCNLSTPEAETEDWDFMASIGYIERACLEGKNTTER